MKKLNLFLKDFGIADIESTIYLNLLKNGTSTVLEVSRRTGLNRITTHINAENLIKKGLVSTLKRGSKRYLVPEPPEKVESIIKAQEFDLERKKALFPEVLNLLRNEISHQGSKTHFDVRTYEGKTAIDYLYDEILKSKELRAFVNAEEINKIYPANFTKFEEASKNAEIEIWDVVENNSFGVLHQKINQHSKYHIKVLPKDVEIGSMDYLIHDNKITIIDGGAEPVAVVISSPSLYVNSKSIFNVMWGLL